MPVAIHLHNYDSQWPQLFEREATRIRSALGDKALRVEHAGSTSIRGLAAKPIIDIILEVTDSAREENYVALLEEAGYTLYLREPDWHQHRVFTGSDTAVNLHVFSSGCAEIVRMLAFRDWLRQNAADRELYERTKRILALQQWSTVQDYADAKTAVVEEILARATGRSRYPPADPATQGD